MTRDTSSNPSASNAPTYYDLLSLRPGASVQDVRRAYRDLSKLYHPDTTELESAIATVKFQALNEAYATLSNPEKRLAYDYQIGYSRLSVMQPLSSVAPGSKPYDPTDSAYISPSDRPLSAGELFALFILGITFVGCLILVFTMGLAKSELPITKAGYPAGSAQRHDAAQPSVTVSPQSELSASSSMGSFSISPATPSPAPHIPPPFSPSPTPQFPTSQFPKKQP